MRVVKGERASSQVPAVSSVSSRSSSWMVCLWASAKALMEVAGLAMFLTFNFLSARIVPMRALAQLDYR